MQLRFQRFGRKHRPFYRLVAIDSRNARDGKALQVSSPAGLCSDDAHQSMLKLTRHCSLGLVRPAYIPGTALMSPLLQYLGWYNPFSKETSLDAPNIKKWLSTGGQPSDTVRDLLKKAMILTTATD